MTRMFVAVIPPERVLEDLEAFVGRRGAARRRSGGPSPSSGTSRWRSPATSPTGVRRPGGPARPRGPQAPPIEARIAGGGAFPDVGRARIVYAGVETDREELRRMATGARAAVAKAGAEVDGQRFTPHLTLARINKPGRGEQVVQLLDAYAGPSWTVEEIALVASYLGEGPRNRARHEVVETFSLGRAGSGPAPDDAPPRGR